MWRLDNPLCRTGRKMQDASPEFRVQTHGVAHAAPPLIAPPTVALEFPAPTVFTLSIYVSTCGPVAPEVGVRPGTVSMPVVFRVVMRMKLPACHVPLMLLLVTSAHQLAVDPPLLPADTTIARWNSGEPVVSGSVMVLFVRWPCLTEGKRPLARANLARSLQT